MSVRPRSRIVGVSALAFVVVLGGLTTLRARNLKPSTAVQPLIADAGAVLVVADVAAHVIHGEDIGTRAGEDIVLAFDPCLGFAANLFVPVSTVESPLRVTYPLIAGTTLTLAVGGVSAAIGYVIRVVRENGTAISRTS